MLTLGLIKYINSIPFYAGLEKEARLILDSPRRLFERFENAEFDASFIPSVAYLKDKEKYTLVPGVSISSFGATRSVFLVYSGALENIDSIVESDDSLTSNFIAPAILRLKYGLSPVPIREEAMHSRSARIVIGDRALEEALIGGEHFLDIGEEWFSLTHLPLVYSLCVARKSSTSAVTSELLTHRRNENLQNLAAVLKERGALQYYDYLTGLDFTLTPAHFEGLRVLESILNSSYKKMESVV
jgi:chorismate dehydratase